MSAARLSLEREITPPGALATLVAFTSVDSVIPNASSYRTKGARKAHRSRHRGRRHANRKKRNLLRGGGNPNALVPSNEVSIAGILSGRTPIRGTKYDQRQSKL